MFSQEESNYYFGDSHVYLDQNENPPAMNPDFDNRRQRQHHQSSASPSSSGVSSSLDGLVEESSVFELLDSLHIDDPVERSSSDYNIHHIVGHEHYDDGDDDGFEEIPADLMYSDENIPFAAAVPLAADDDANDLPSNGGFVEVDAEAVVVEPIAEPMNYDGHLDDDDNIYSNDFEQEHYYEQDERFYMDHHVDESDVLPPCQERQTHPHQQQAKPMTANRRIRKLCSKARRVSVKAAKRATEQAKEFNERHQVSERSKIAALQLGRQMQKTSKSTAKGIRNFEHRHQLMAKSQRSLSRATTSLRDMMMNQQQSSSRHHGHSRHQYNDRQRRRSWQV